MNLKKENQSAEELNVDADDNRIFQLRSCIRKFKDLLPTNYLRYK